MTNETSPISPYSEANVERLRKSIQSLEAGKGTIHELIEADDE